MTTFSYTTASDPRPKLGLIVLQSDETVEDELHRMLTPAARLMVSRVPSGTEVTTDTLAEMQAHLTDAAALFPQGYTFDAVGYACTSGSAVIGSDKVAERMREGLSTPNTTDPVTALIAACRAAKVQRLAFLSPYIETVSARLRDTLNAAGITIPSFGTFAEANEARVARIDAPSIIAAAREVAHAAPADAVFLSCTNLRTLDILNELQDELGCPIWSSNLVLGWHLACLSGAQPTDALPADLLPKRK